MTALLAAHAGAAAATLLIWLIVGILAVGLVYWVATLIGLPRQAAAIAAILVGLILLLYWLG